MDHFDVIIVGAGASGLMCALTAGQRGRSVLILEKNNEEGKKILVSGGGRCNFTNLFLEPDNYISANPHFCKSALKRYTQYDFIALMERYRIPVEEREQGQMFCRDSAGNILNMLLEECRKANVLIRTGCKINSIRTNNNENNPAHRFSLSTDKGEFTAASVVIATGGVSMPALGAGGFGYEIARQFGLKVLPTRAGLVPFSFTGSLKDMMERLAGISLEVLLRTREKSFKGNVLFTHRGLSGPAALQLSNYWLEGHPITINLLPEIELKQWLRAQKRDQPKSLVRNLLASFLPKSLLRELQDLFWKQRTEVPAAEIPDSALDHIAVSLTNWQIKPSGTEGYRTAEVTLGGVDTDELSSKTMESKSVPGLFFTGEVVDVTGHLGGYNLQWAWSSGYAAGQFV